LAGLAFAAVRSATGSDAYAFGAAAFVFVLYWLGWVVVTGDTGWLDW
jgi:hypothetical protein